MYNHVPRSGKLHQSFAVYDEVRMKIDGKYEQENQIPPCREQAGQALDSSEFCVVPVGEPLRIALPTSCSGEFHATGQKLVERCRYYI